MIVYGDKVYVSVYGSSRLVKMDAGPTGTTKSREIPVSVGLAVTAAAVPEETVPTVTVSVVPAGP